MPEAPKKSVRLPFPVGGIVDGSSHTDQPANTTHDAKNVLPFDTSELRMRGGRRKGVVKTTDNSLSNNNIQLLMSSDIVNSVGTIASGGTMTYPDDHDLAGDDVILNYSELSDGSQIDQNSLGYTFYGMSGTAARNSGSGYAHILLVNNNTNDIMHASYGASILQAVVDDTSIIKQRPVRLMSGNNCAFLGLTKQSSDTDIPYIQLDPSVFEFNQTQYDGTRNPERSWGSKELFHPDDRDAMRNQGSDFRQASDEVSIHKFAHLFPQHEFDQKPWNTSSDKTYTTRLEFSLPSGPSHTFTEGDSGGEVTFVGSVAAELTDNKIYDPYYNELMGDADLSESIDANNTFKPFETYEENIGLIFRIGADFQLVEDAEFRSDWVEDYYKNGSEPTEGNAALAFYFKRKPVGGTDGNIASLAWNLYASTPVWHHNSFLGGDDTPVEETLVSTNVVAANDTNYHNFEISINNNRLDIFLDGILIKHYADITAAFLDIATDLGEDLTDSFGYGGFFYHHHNKVQRTSGSGSDDNTKRQLSYFCSYDWNTRSNASGDTLESVHAGITGNTRKGSKTWRIRSFAWLEANVNESSSRIVLAISGGNIFESSNGSSFSQVSTAGTIDPAARVVDGISYFQKIYLVDGSNYKIYDPGTDALSDWDATGDPTMPGGEGSTGLNGAGTYDDNPRCSIIEIFNGRVIMAGKTDEPHNWFMSAIGDPLDWDIGESIPYGGAVTGGNSDIGESSDPITAFAPMTDDRLLMGGTNSIHILTGDPSNPSTQLISVSRDVGIVGQDAWCYGPNKSVFFMGENGLYNVQPNDFDVAQNNRVSLGKMDTTFTSIDFSSNRCRLIYDHSLYGVHIFLNPHTRDSNPLTHYFYDTRSDSFWTMEMPSIFGPTAAVDYQDLDPTARKILLGGYDGHLRTFDDSALDDDGTIIESYVWVGPIQISGDREGKLTELIAVLDEQTEGVGYEVYAADTVEAAKSSSPVVSGSWTSGRNGSSRLRVRGSAIFVRLNSEAVATPWAVENLTAMLAVAGRVRQR